MRLGLSSGEAEAEGTCPECYAEVVAPIEVRVGDVRHMDRGNHWGPWQRTQITMFESKDSGS